MIPLTIILKKITIDKNSTIEILYIRRAIGAIFCQVNRIAEFDQFKPSITSGNQKWKGAVPIFVKREEFITIK